MSHKFIFSSSALVPVGEESTEPVPHACYPGRVPVTSDRDLIPRDHLDRYATGRGDPPHTLPLCKFLLVLTFFTFLFYSVTFSNVAQADVFAILPEMDGTSVGVVRLYVHVEPIGTSEGGGEDSCNQVLD